MDPRSTDEARALRDAVRGLLAKRSDPFVAADSPAGYDEVLWATLCEQIGVASLLVPEEYGGAGATMAEMSVVLEELGRTLTPAPLLGSAVLAVRALLESGDADACARLLPGIAEGRVAALAWTGESGDWSPSQPAVHAEGTGTLHGTAHYVLDGDGADVLLAAARTGDGVGLFEVDTQDPGLRRRHTPAMDATRRLAVCEFVGVPGSRLGEGDYTPALHRVRDVALVALAVEQAGTAARALEITVEYTGQRHQFGRAVGGFQALKHRMADAFVSVEVARSASHAALLSELAGSSEAGADAAVAKVSCAEALEHVAAEMIQLHGGIAITWEHPAHRYFKRAHGGASLFGAPRQYVEELHRVSGVVPAP